MENNLIKIWLGDVASDQAVEQTCLYSQFFAEALETAHIKMGLKVKGDMKFIQLEIALIIAIAAFMTDKAEVDNSSKLLLTFQNKLNKIWPSVVHAWEELK